MPNWVHNGITVSGPGTVIYPLAKKIVDRSIQIDKTTTSESQKSETICRCYIDDFKTDHRNHSLCHGTLQELIHESKHYEEFREVIEPEGILVDFDTNLFIDTKYPDTAKGVSDSKNIHDLTSDEEIVDMFLSFDTKWDNQNTIYSIALLEMCMDIDPDLGALCTAYGGGSEELLHFENACIVVNQVNFEDEIRIGQHVLYKSQTNRNGLVRYETADHSLSRDTWQVFEYLYKQKDDADVFARNICNKLLENVTELIDIHYSINICRSGWLVTFKAQSDQLLAGKFYKAISDFNYPIYSDSQLTDMPYVGMPHFYTIGKFIGNTVPVKFDGSDVPTFVYGEAIPEWTKLGKTAPTKRTVFNPNSEDETDPYKYEDLTDGEAPF